MWAGSPGLVVMGGDSRFKSRGFESWHCILDGHFFTYFCCKKYDVCFKRPKLNKKRPRLPHFLKKTNLHDLQLGFIHRLLCRLRRLVRNTNYLHCSVWSNPSTKCATTTLLRFVRLYRTVAFSHGTTFWTVLQIR